MYTLTQAKDFVINQGYAIKNDDSVEKLREVLKFCFPEDLCIANQNYNYYFRDKQCDIFICWLMDDSFEENSINLSEIELETFNPQVDNYVNVKIGDALTIEMVIELRKQYPNNLEFGDAFDILVGGMK